MSSVFGYIWNFSQDSFFSFRVNEKGTHTHTHTWARAFNSKQCSVAICDRTLSCNRTDQFNFRSIWIGSELSLNMRFFPFDWSRYRHRHQQLAQLIDDRSTVYSSQITTKYRWISNSLNSMMIVCTGDSGFVCCETQRCLRSMTQFRKRWFFLWSHDSF